MFFRRATCLLIAMMMTLLFPIRPVFCESTDAQSEEQEETRHTYDPIMMIDTCNFKLTMGGSASRWMHMCKQRTTYHIDYSGLQSAWNGISSQNTSEFEGWLGSAIAEWGSNITMSKVSDSPNVIRFVHLAPATRPTQYGYVDDDGHIVLLNDQGRAAADDEEPESYARDIESEDENLEMENEFEQETDNDELIIDGTGAIREDSHLVTIVGENDPYRSFEYFAVTYVNCDTNSGKILNWTMEIDIDNFYSITTTDAHRKHILAHEIGHAYGLAHNEYSGSIMQQGHFDIAHPSSDDIFGMQVVTHIDHHMETDFTFTNYTSTQHKAHCTRCVGSASVYLPHDFGAWQNYTLAQHRCSCRLCGRYKYQDHSFGAWSSYDESQHRRKCIACARYQYADHAFGSAVYYDAQRHRRKCTSCTKYKYETHTWQYTGGYLRCSQCGYEKPYA